MRAAGGGGVGLACRQNQPEASVAQDFAAFLIKCPHILFAQDAGCCKSFVQKWHTRKLP